MHAYSLGLTQLTNSYIKAGWAGDTGRRVDVRVQAYSLCWTVNPCNMKPSCGSCQRTFLWLEVSTPAQTESSRRRNENHSLHIFGRVHRLLFWVKSVQVTSDNGESRAWTALAARPFIKLFTWGDSHAPPLWVRTHRWARWGPNKIQSLFTECSQPRVAGRMDPRNVFMLARVNVFFWNHSCSLAV